MWDDRAMLQPLDIQRGSLREHFPTGRFSMVEDGIYPFEMDNAIQGKFAFGYQHTPKGPTGNRKVLGTTDGYAIWKGSKKQDEAWELVGPLIVSFSIIALSEVTRPVRWVTLPLGLWLIAAPWLLGAGWPAPLHDAAVGLVIAALAAVAGGRMEEGFGGGWSALWRSRP